MNMLLFTCLVCVLPTVNFYYHVLVAIECPALSPIANGTITYAPDTTADYDQGTVAIYICDDGFNLVGDMQRTCQIDGTFSGTDPTCSLIRELNITIYKIISHWEISLIKERSNNVILMAPP